MCKKSTLDDWLAIARNSVDIDTDLFISGEFLVQQCFLVCAICFLEQFTVYAVDICLDIRIYTFFVLK